MVAALIFVIALAALLQFASSYWRALLLTIAAEPISERLEQAVAGSSAPTPSDFSALLAWYGACPRLGKEGRGVCSVSFYYRLLGVLKAAFGRTLPDVSAWADREMAACSSYVAVLVDRRLQQNFALADQIRSW